MEKLILWDFEGTLGHRLTGWSGAFHEVLLEIRPETEHTVEDVRPLLQAGFPGHTPEVAHTHLTIADEWWSAFGQTVVAVYRRLGIGDAEAVGCRDLLRSRYAALAGWALYDDTLPALATLRDAGWRHVLLTNHVPELGNILDGLGLTHFFDRIVNSAVTGYEKPHPEAFRLALGSDRPGAVWMVGDNPVADVAGAEAAGIPAILVRTDAPAVARRYADLAGVVELLGAGRPG